MTPDEFMDWVMPEPNSGCWLWDGGITRNHIGAAYGIARLNKRVKKAHRIAYELFKGPIPAGKEIDHLCRVTLCVNPAHLEAVTHRENVLRGIGPTAENAKKTHCDNGHELAGDNVIATKTGRACKICNRYSRKMSARRERARDREAHNAYRRARYWRLKNATQN